MKINLVAIAALALAVVVGYLAYDGVSQRRLEGTALTFDVGTGRVELLNNSDEAVPVTMNSNRVFSVMTSGSEEALASTRQGSGRNLTHVVETELLPGDMAISITRGSDVTFTINAPESIQALVTPRSEADTQSMITTSAVIILVLLAVAAYSSRQWWLRLLRRQPAAPTPLKEQVFK